MRDDADGEDEEEEENDEDDEDTESEQDKSWLSSKPNSRSSRRPSQQTNCTIKKVNSYSSMDSSTGHNNNIVSRNQWQDNLSSPTSPTASSNRYNSTHKEKPVASLPPTQLQTSKSTPTKSNATKYEEFDLEKDEYNSLGQHEPVVIKRPPRNSSRVIVRPSVTQNSNRSSISSINSTTSSIESSTSVVEQPQMALPSLKTATKRDTVAVVDENTPIPSKKSNFRARTSSLPKSSPLMQRSSSMSTMDNIIATHEIDEEEGKIHVSSHQPAPPPPPLIINRPIVSRPSVGGSLGSMRKKAANRLSMEGLVSRNRHHGNSNSYGFVLKDQIQATPQELEYATEQQYQQQSQPFERSDSYSSNGQSAMMDDAVFLDDQQHQQQQANSHLKLILALEKSMTEGAHITQKLYIPKNLW